MALKIIARYGLPQYRSSHRRCSIKKVFIKILQSSQENTCARVTLTQVFSCEFCKIFKNSFFTEYIRANASDNKNLLRTSVIFRAAIFNSFMTIVPIIKKKYRDVCRERIKAIFKNLSESAFNLQPAQLFACGF